MQYRISILVPDQYLEQAREAGVALGFSDMSEYSVRLSWSGDEPPTYHGLSTLASESFASIIKPCATLGHACVTSVDGNDVCTLIEVPDPSEEVLEAIIPFAPLLEVMKVRIDLPDADALAQFNLLCEENGVRIITEKI